MRTPATALVLLLTLGLPACGDDDPPAAAVAATTTTTAPATSVPPTTEPVGTAVAFEISLPVASFAGGVCEGEACLFPLSRTGVTVTGDLAGRAASAGAGSESGAGELAGANYTVFVGEVAGCGTGSVKWADVGVGPAGALKGTWQIVAGTGTGDLTGMVGGGTFELTTNADYSAHATSRGTISCGAS